MKEPIKSYGPSLVGEFPEIENVKEFSRQAQIRAAQREATKQVLIDAARRNNYMPDPSIPLHKQSLLSVTPPTPEEKAEAEWDLPEADPRYQIGDQILAAELDPEADAVYAEHKAKLDETHANIQATVRQLEKDRDQRFREEYPEYVRPEPDSQSYRKIKKIVG